MNWPRFAALGAITLLELALSVIAWRMLPALRQAIPLWALLIAVIALCGLPALFSTARHDRRDQRLYRIANGLCVKCGYDLRGNPDVCPGCGAAVRGDERVKG